MLEKAVCNASPLIFLSKLGVLDLLDEYRIYIPLQVEAEVLKGSKNQRADAENIIAYLTSKKIKPKQAVLLGDLPGTLGPGEKAVINLAVREGIDKVLIDESRARSVARFKGLKPKGTIGILWDAYKDGRINRKTAESLVLDLVQKGYRIKEEILVHLLKMLREK